MPTELGYLTPCAEPDLRIPIEFDRLTDDHAEMLTTFSCGNEVIDEHFRAKAFDEINSITYLFIDKARNCAAAAATLCCSSIPITDGRKYIDGIPAVEITAFAVDERYQGMVISREPTKEYFSDFVLSTIIRRIYEFTEQYCGAEYVILYSTPRGHSLYERNLFCDYDHDIFMVKQKRYLEGCIPMYLAL